MAVPTSSTKWLASNAWLRSATSLLPQAKPWIWWPESELIFTYGLADGPTSCWYHGSSVGINPSKPPPPMVSVLLFHCASVGSSTAQLMVESGEDTICPRTMHTSGNVPSALRSSVRVSLAPWGKVVDV